jgi:hypothetical protein
MADVQIPQKEWAAVKKMVREAAKPEMISETEAAMLLGVSVKTIKNYVYAGKITTDMYTSGISGKRFYHKEKLMGF